MGPEEIVCLFMHETRREWTTEHKKTRELLKDEGRGQGRRGGGDVWRNEERKELGRGEERI